MKTTETTTPKTTKRTTTRTLNTKATKTTMKEILNSAKSAIVRFLSDDRLAPAIFLGAALLLAIVLGWVLGHNNSTVIQIVEQAAGNFHAADGASAAMACTGRRTCSTSGHLCGKGSERDRWDQLQ